MLKNYQEPSLQWNLILYIICDLSLCGAIGSTPVLVRRFCLSRRRGNHGRVGLWQRSWKPPWVLKSTVVQSHPLPPLCNAINIQKENDTKKIAGRWMDYCIFSDSDPYTNILCESSLIMPITNIEAVMWQTKLSTGDVQFGRGKPWSILRNIRESDSRHVRPERLKVVVVVVVAAAAVGRKNGHALQYVIAANCL